METTVKIDRKQEMLNRMAAVQIEATIKAAVSLRVIDAIASTYRSPGIVVARARNLASGVSMPAVAASIGPMPERCVDHVEQVVSLAYAPIGTRH